jgi:hypothetical protein
MMKPLVIPTVILFLVIFRIADAPAQKVHKIGTHGKYESRELPREKVIEKAILNGKKNSLIYPGLPKEFPSAEFVILSPAGLADTMIRAILAEVSENNSGGEVIETGYSITTDVTDDTGNLKVQLKINTQLFLYDRPKDPSFTLEVSGLFNIYYTSQRLAFSVRPLADGYLKIFRIAGDSVRVLYPDNTIQDRVLRKDVTVRFPFGSSSAGFELALPGRSVASRNEFLLFVFTKEQLLHKSDLDFHGLMLWIYSISPDQRFCTFRAFMIKK